jgi:predicted SnoaL-like aldol condensation-catalyzing enzyme
MSLTATLVMPGCAVATGHTPRDGASEDSARAVFERFVDLLYRRRQVRAAFESCVVATGYIEHVPGGFGSRAQAMATLGQRFSSTGLDLQVLHTVFEGGVGMVHLTVRNHAAVAHQHRVEIFRVVKGRISEHWAVVA